MLNFHCCFFRWFALFLNFFFVKIQHFRDKISKFSKKMKKKIFGKFCDFFLLFSRIFLIDFQLLITFFSDFQLIIQFFPDSQWYFPCRPCRRLVRGFLRGFAPRSLAFFFRRVYSFWKSTKNSMKSEKNAWKIEKIRWNWAQKLVMT